MIMPPESAKASPEAPAFQQHESRLWAYHAAILFASGLLVRIWLIHAYPVIFGGDSIVRLANRDRILLAYQLPLLQAGIHYLSLLSENPLLIRYGMALIGAVAGVGFYYMAVSLMGRATAFSCALFFVSSPFVLAYSVVPYQEILMLAALFFSFHFFFEENWSAASLCLGLACLTRYEAWLACPVLALAFAMKRRPHGRGLLKGCLLFGWAPLAWTAYHGGITPSGTFALETNLNAERLWRFVYLGWITVKNTPLPVLALAALGLWRFWKQGLLRAFRFQMLAAFLVLFLVSVLFSAHGERDQPDRFVTAREAHVLLAAVIVLAGLGLNRVRRYGTALVIASLLTGLFMADRMVARESSAPHFQLSHRMALYLDQHVLDDQQVAVLAKAIPQPLLGRFLEKAERQGGTAGRRKALEVLIDLDASPPDYQRILVHSRLGKDQLKSLSRLPLQAEDGLATPKTIEKTPSREEPAATDEAAQPLSEDRPANGPTLRESTPDWPDWVVVWSDFEPTNSAEAGLQRRLAGREPEHVLRRGPLSVAAYRLSRRKAGRASDN